MREHHTFTRPRLTLTVYLTRSLSIEERGEGSLLKVTSLGFYLHFFSERRQS